MLMMWLYVVFCYILLGFGPFQKKNVVLYEKPLFIIIFATNFI